MNSTRPGAEDVEARTTLQMYSQTPPSDDYGCASRPLIPGRSTLRISLGPVGLVDRAEYSMSRVAAQTPGMTTHTDECESAAARQVASENMDAAESAIDDADFAFEVSQLSRGWVLANRATLPSHPPGECGLSLQR